MNGYLWSFIGGVVVTHLFWLAVFFGWALWEARGLGELPPQPFDHP